MKKTAASGAKTPLFDRVFKPEVITLENGHTVTRPRSRTPLIALLAAPMACGFLAAFLLPKGAKGMNIDDIADEAAAKRA